MRRAKMAFVVTSGSVVEGRTARAAVGVPRTSACVPRGARAVVRMSSDLDDVAMAKKCAEGGCSVTDVQAVLERLESRRKALDREASEIQRLMAKLAKSNMEDNRNELEKLVDAAVFIFSKSNDDFPATGVSMGYTMDVPKKK